MDSHAALLILGATQAFLILAVIALTVWVRHLQGQIRILRATRRHSDSVRGEQNH